MYYVGNAVSGTGGATLGDQITLSAEDMKYAVTMPSSGTLSEVHADYVLTSAEQLTRDMTLSARLYTAPAGSLTFTYLPGSDFTLTPTLSGSVPAGTVLTGSVFPNAAVNAGEKLLAAVYLNSAAAGDAQSVTGVTALSAAVRA